MTDQTGEWAAHYLMQTGADAGESRPASRVMVSARLNLHGTQPPTIELAWHADAGAVTLLFRGNNINQFLGFDGTPQEVRQTLTRGLERLDKAVADHAADPPDHAAARG